MLKEGWAVVPVPATTQEEWKGNCKKKWWKGRRLAHIFDDGWYDGSFKRKFPGECATDRWMFYYSDDKLEYGHVLLMAATRESSGSS